MHEEVGINASLGILDPQQLPFPVEEGKKYWYNKNNPKEYGEVRVTDPNTGGQKGSKLARFSLIPAQFLWALAEHYGKGAHKYEPRNWEKGYAWTLGMDALERHYNAWKAREDVDPETGTHHLIAVAWHAAALYMFQLCGLGTDDRSKLQEKK